MQKVIEDNGIRIILADPEINLSPNGRMVLEKRYLRKDETGKLMETPEKLFKRVAHNIAQADKIYRHEKEIEPVEEEFYNVMSKLEFVPNSPTLMNAGRKLQQLSACFVLPVDDSMESIFESVKNTALVHKSGGGTGFSFSRLRPRNDYVSSTYGLSSGPISFMKAFDAATEAVNQGGFRRGANMAIMRVDHPDILEFITCKQKENVLNNFNISVAVSDTFMKAVEKNGEYDLINPRSGKAVKRLKALEVFQLIVSMAWQNGEPGIIFLDEINRHNPTPHIGAIESTNPCGEQPLLPYEACNLGSINLGKMVSGGKIDYAKLRETVWTAVHFLDNVIDMSKFPLEQITKMVNGNRKIGLGIMGFADMLIQLGIPYNSEQGLQFADDVMSFVQEESKEASVELAKTRGVFPNFEGSVYDKPDKKFPIRNATTTTIAPTGSISIIANCSSGMEPLFAISYWRNVLDGEKLVEINPYFKEIAQSRGFYTEELMRKIAESGSLQNISEIPADVKRLFVTAHDISPEWHIRMQAVFQNYTDNAVSKTVNFPAHASKADVEKVYMLAYELKCKGVTVYRDKSRSKQVLSAGDNGEKTKEPALFKKSPVQKSIADNNKRRQRPSLLDGKTVQMKTGCGSLYVTVNKDEKGPFELFATMGKAGGCAASQNEAIGRLISLAWRSGIPTDVISRQLIGISCHKQIGLGKNKILSCADAIAKAIKLYTGHIDTKLVKAVKPYGACPECGSPMDFEGGCAVCKSCGYSQCD